MDYLDFIDQMQYSNYHTYIERKKLVKIPLEYPGQILLHL